MRDLERQSKVDRLVAEHVLGLEVFDVNYCGTPDETAEQRKYRDELSHQGYTSVGTYGRKPDGTIIDLGSAFTPAWQPTMNIEHAWAVVEKMRRLRPDWRLSILGGDEDMPRWWVRYFGVTMGSDDKGEAYNESLPLAICLAALKALGVEVGDE